MLSALGEKPPQPLASCFHAALDKYTLDAALLVKPGREAVNWLPARLACATVAVLPVPAPAAKVGRRAPSCVTTRPSSRVNTRPVYECMAGGR